MTLNCPSPFALFPLSSSWSAGGSVYPGATEAAAAAAIISVLGFRVSQVVGAGQVKQMEQINK